MEKDIHANGNKRKVRWALLISIKIDFEARTITKDKEDNYVITKGSNPRRRYNICKCIAM